MTSPLGAVQKLGEMILESLLGTPTFIWNDNQVPCVPSTLRRGTTLNFGGFDVVVSMTLFVRKELFFNADKRLQVIDGDIMILEDRSRPVAGRTLIFKGKTYRILLAREPATGEHFELEVADINR